MFALLPNKCYESFYEDCVFKQDVPHARTPLTPRQAECWVFILHRMKGILQNPQLGTVSPSSDFCISGGHFRG